MATIKQKEGVKGRFDIWEVVKDYPAQVRDWNFVYLFKCGEYYKIGISSNPKSRIGSIQTGNPYKVEMVQALRVPDAYKVEQLLHKKFYNLKIKREWFRLSKRDIEWMWKYLMNYASGSLNKISI